MSGSRLCLAGTPDQTEAVQPVAKRQRAARSKPNSSDEVRAGQLGLLGRASPARSCCMRSFHSRDVRLHVCLQTDQPSRSETPAPSADQPPGAAQSKAAGKRPARAASNRSVNTLACAPPTRNHYRAQWVDAAATDCVRTVCKPCRVVCVRSFCRARGGA